MTGPGESAGPEIVTAGPVAVAGEAPPSSAGTNPALRWWVLVVVGLGQLMVVLDATIVNIALPSAQHDLAFSNADRQWVVTAYSLAFGGLLLLGGRLSDLVGRRRLLPRQPRDPDVRLDPAGTALVVAGLVALVYGLSEADTKGWGAPLTLTLLVAGVILLAAFVVVERRVQHPLLPLRIVLDRFRGGSYLAILLSAMGMFGLFLFLTYYLQELLRYSPVTTGLAFLPLVAALIAASTTASALLLPRLGPRVLVPAGLIIAAGGLALLGSQIGLHTSYPGSILPGLVIMGLGLGLVFGCALNTATYGAAAADADVASAMVNTNQQVGGSIGTALLNTIAASAFSSYLLSRGHSPLAQAGAAVHSYVVAFWVSAGIFAAAAIVCGLVLPPGVLAPAGGDAAPAMA